MPEEFKNIITIELKVPVRQKPCGVYEARFRSYGYNISVSSKEKDLLKPKFFAALKNYVQKMRAAEVEELAFPVVQKPPLFTEVAARWLELKRAEIKANTYKFYVQLLGANIYPVFLGVRINEIKQSDVQKLINDYYGQGKFRTSLKIFQTLSAVFNFAVGEELLERSPMRLLKPPKCEERTGQALTREEERELIELVVTSNCAEEVKNALLLLLYTGIRRSELASVQNDDGFISVLNAKTRKGCQEKRRLIPITPMLARWLPNFNFESMRTVRPDLLTQTIKRFMPAHHLHELRHTYITRCQECGVPREVVSVWAGHAADGTQTSTVYTHFSREFMREQAQKVVYDLIPR